MNEQSIAMPITCVVGGRVWRLYGVEYDTADGKFCTYIHALSWDHAVMRLEELKESARVYGEIVGEVPGGPET